MAANPRAGQPGLALGIVDAIALSLTAQTGPLATEAGGAIRQRPCRGAVAVARTARRAATIDVWFASVFDAINAMQREADIDSDG